MPKTIPLAMFLCAGLLSACDHLKPGDFSAQKPAFAPEKFFAGHVKSWGVIESRGGDPTDIFATDIVGTSHAPDDLTIDQHFDFADGRKEHRVWDLHRVDEHRYTATANDVIGTGIGYADGNSFLWEYTLELKPGNALSRVHMRQWMYLQGDGSVMMNRVAITKLGVLVAQVSEYFHRE